ncbi:pentapeptide repeat-containing protein [Nostoc sp. LEGE 12450]|uniref:pentapeptide repeat-containing protein n=1 Tax=Nostoc sp. LEGE 12450 TaxID=1828643 RepID=UPI001882362D|nr:pentapeptide repeat-containing protein [Nostoc sp. LEGE 12450]MBE8986510.1 pentapeptide repeat-containing protein [Nostoc sp. LEGE 12450]
MKVKRQRITAEELLSRYAAGERDFTRFIEDSREGLIRGLDLSNINLEASILIIDLSGAILRNDFDNADFSEVNLYG